MTEHLDLWSAAVTIKSAAGRGGSSKVELYGLKKLRELILELAVRGLLVAQDPQDEPASSLLKKIAVEKARLIKAGKIKKQKKLPPITEDEMPFDLPEGWEWARLDNFVYIEMGQSPSSKYYNSEGEGLPFFQGKADFGETYPTPRYWCVRPQKFAYPNDVLLSVRAPVGPTNISNIECCIGRGLAALRPLAKTPTLFLWYLMRAFQNFLESFATGTTFAAVTKTHVENLLIPIPPLAEQHRIVAKVDELMALCDRLEAQQEQSISTHQTLVHTLLSALTESGAQGRFEQAWERIADHFDLLFTTEESIELLKQSLLQLAVMGRLVPQNPADEPASALLKKIAAEKAKLVKAGKIKQQEKLPPIREDEKPFDLPMGWEWVRLGDVAEHCLGKMLDHAKNRGQYQPYLRNLNIRWKGFEFNDLKEMRFEAHDEERYGVKSGDILVCEGGEPGRAAIWKEEIENMKIQKAIHRVRFFNGIDGEFFLNYLMWSAISNNLDKYFTGSGIKHLTGKSLAKFVFPLAPIIEQKAITVKVDELMALCDRLKVCIQASRAAQHQLADAIAARARGQGC